MSIDHEFDTGQWTVTFQERTVTPTVQFGNFSGTGDVYTEVFNVPSSYWNLSYDGPYRIQLYNASDNTLYKTLLTDSSYQQFKVTNKPIVIEPGNYYMSIDHEFDTGQWTVTFE